MLAMWTQAIVSIWSDDGHIHSSNHTEAAASDSGGEARDCRRDIGEGGGGRAGSASARGQRQPGIQLARAVSSGATEWERRQGYAVARESNCRRIGGDLVRIIPIILAGQDSHSTAACASEHR